MKSLFWLAALLAVSCVTGSVDFEPEDLNQAYIDSRKVYGGTGVVDPETAYNANAEYERFLETHGYYSQARKLGGDLTYEGAEQSDASAAQAPSEEAVAAYRRGSTLETQGDLAAAVGEYTLAIELFPDFVQAYSKRALCYSRTNQRDKAMSDFGEVIRITPKDASAYYYRGLLYSLKKDFENALKDYDKAVDNNADYVNAYNNRGVSYSQIAKPDFKKAVKDFDTAVKLDDQNIWAYFNRGNVYYFKLNEAAKGIADFKKVAELDPEGKLSNIQSYLSAEKQQDYDRHFGKADKERYEEIHGESAMAKWAAREAPFAAGSRYRVNAACTGPREGYGTTFLVGGSIALSDQNIKLDLPQGEYILYFHCLRFERNIFFIETEYVELRLPAFNLMLAY
ncbi:MAG: tetratricopeptide repeat protein [Treponema sp.]|jgi:tetratricopeptide (TPR) repeat protein|nr:tetratricopeptide repeat protein [Treponema sp.]